MAVPTDQEGRRLDQFLASQVDLGLSRSQLQRLVKEGRCLVNGEPSRPARMVAAGEQVVLELPDPESPTPAAEDIPLEVVYEDPDLIVINKPRGMVVHPAPGHGTGTLVNALLFHCHDLSGINRVMRPGIVHRLDKDTTGLLVAAKNDRAHLILAQQLKERRVTREYLALVHGSPLVERGIIEADLGRDPRQRQRMAVVESGGRQAITRFRVVERFPAHGLLAVSLDTGRTHQIRVHLAYIGFPVVGDPLYGARRDPLGLTGQALHARLLGFVHPATEEWLEFSVPPPADMARALELAARDSRRISGNP